LQNQTQFASEKMRGNKNAQIHGFSRTHIYSVWVQMRRRCRENNTEHSKYYKNRGIKVCNEWKKDFMSFYKWAIANGYKEELTIERKDVNGNYEPENCTWATSRAQANNKRNTIKITYNGKTKSLSEWADIIDLPYHVLFKRYKKGWENKEILTTPLAENKSHKHNQSMQGGRGAGVC
jgi:hypothetical protein